MYKNTLGELFYIQQKDNIILIVINPLFVERGLSKINTYKKYHLY